MSIEETRFRLREWGALYRDSPERIRTGSAEGNWRSPQVWNPIKPRQPYDEIRARETWAVLQQIDPPGREEVRPAPLYRALTWRYCYSFLPQGIALRALRRRLGYRVSPRDFDDLVAAGENAVLERLYPSAGVGYSARQFAYTGARRETPVQHGAPSLSPLPYPSR